LLSSPAERYTAPWASRSAHLPLEILEIEPELLIDLLEAGLVVSASSMTAEKIDPEC